MRTMQHEAMLAGYSWRAWSQKEAAGSSKLLPILKDIFQLGKPTTTVGKVLDYGAPVAGGVASAALADKEFDHNKSMDAAAGVMGAGLSSPSIWREILSIKSPVKRNTAILGAVLAKPAVVGGVGLLTNSYGLSKNLKDTSGELARVSKDIADSSKQTVENTAKTSKSVADHAEGIAAGVENSTNNWGDLNKQLLSLDVPARLKQVTGAIEAGGKAQADMISLLQNKLGDTAALKPWLMGAGAVAGIGGVAALTAKIIQARKQHRMEQERLRIEKMQAQGLSQIGKSLAAN